MLQLARESISGESLRAERRATLVWRSLDRDGPVMADVVREIDNRHTARAKLVLQHIAACKGLPKTLR